VPGSLGSAVIAGHRGWKAGPAVFDDLDKINIGDEVKVLDEKGAEHVFKVRDKRIYNAEDKIPEVWKSTDGSHLNLITCSGKRNIFTGSAQNRLVVFTDLAI
jgi:LPXTG-site transpeptidase (sortase) family protein